MKEVQPWMGRTELLLGPDKLKTLVNSNVLVVGLGGVGGIAAEMIARAGVGKMTIVDADNVDQTNRNRQLVALKSTENKIKAEVLGERLLDINPDLELQILPVYFRDQITEEVLNNHFDYAVDCIDTLSPKVYFIKACIDRGIPIVSSMGAGSKVDPTRLKVADISATYNCHLAKYVRKYLHRLGVYKGVKAVFSDEQRMPEFKVVETPDDMRKKSVVGTISYMPTVFGCTVASVCIRDLYNR